jgi:hypothetical protein
MRVYKGASLQGMGDWLGTGAIGPMDHQWRPFEEARRFVPALNLKTGREWGAYCRGERPHIQTKPINIPVQADKVYKDKGWISWPDLLGKN